MQRRRRKGRCKPLRLVISQEHAWPRSSPSDIKGVEERKSRRGRTNLIESKPIAVLTFCLTK